MTNIVLDKINIKVSQRDSQLTADKWNLVTSNLHLVDDVLNYIKTNSNIVNQDPDEYIEAGTWSLIHAARKFDVERTEAQFSTYAVVAIRRSMFKVLKIKKKERKRFSQDSCFCSQDETMTDFEKNQIVKEDGVIGDIVASEELQRIKKMISEAPKDIKEIIVMRIYEDKTFKEIGDSLSMSGEMARLNYKAAINYMKEKMT